MGLVGTELKNATVISVAHRPELEVFHSRKIVLERRVGPSHFVSDVPLNGHAGVRGRLRSWLNQLTQRNAPAREGGGR